jgi:hypothetical protein
VPIRFIDQSRRGRRKVIDMMLGGGVASLTCFGSQRLARVNRESSLPSLGALDA